MYEDQNSVLGRAVFEEKPLPISDRDAKLEQLNTQMAEITNRIDTLENSGIDAEAREDITEINELLGDDELETEAQTITGAINELKSSETDPVTINDTLTSTSATEALSAKQGKILKDGLDTHKAESATEEKLGHVIVDGKTILVDENGVISGAALTNKNLLHNWDFRNPVNQRGFTSTTNAGYTIDRWQLAASGHTVEVVSDGIKLIAGKNAVFNNCFVQLVENYSSLVGVPLTLSIHIVENTLTQGCNLRWNDYASPVIMGTGYFSFTFTPSSLSSLQIGVQFNNRDVDDGNYLIIDKMKLEIGEVSTLANDPPADYGEQLMLCKRFFRLWTTEAARTEALKEVGLMRIPTPTLGTIDIGGTTYYYASADL